MQKAGEKFVLASAEDIDRLGYLLLARIASSGRSLSQSEIVADLALFAGVRLSASQWRGTVERRLEALAAAGLIAAEAAGYTTTEAGAAAAAKFLGTAGEVPRSWEQVCDLWLIAKALGWPRKPAKRLAALRTPEGLRAAILTHAYGLQIKGAATPARLRGALAARAFEKAFGGARGLTAKLGLSAPASRLLAAQLLGKPRELGTDRRLVAALAAESVGATGRSLGALRLAVLRQFFGAPERPSRARRERRMPLLVTPAPSPSSAMQEPPPCASAATLTPAPPTVQVPDLLGFALEVRRLAASAAQGWSGDRKAYISHVWHNVREQRPEWGLSETEFKRMLAEAHRSGRLALANADLKDEDNIKDVLDSAVADRNAVFHFIRVDT